jgi:hypothetical protein
MTGRTNNEISCVMISYVEPVHQQWDTLSRDLIWRHREQQQEVICFMISYDKQCTSNDGLNMSRNLTLWHSVAGIRSLVSWFDLMTQWNSYETLCCVKWFDDTIKQLWDTLLREMVWWHNKTAMRHFVAWKDLMTQWNSYETLRCMKRFDDTMEQLWDTLLHEMVWWHNGEAMRHFVP